VTSCEFTIYWDSLYSGWPNDEHLGCMTLNNFVQFRYKGLHITWEAMQIGPAHSCSWKAILYSM
jgi:hypothetical protein